MTTSELKNKLITEIQSTTDELLLREVSKLLSIELNEIESPFILTKEMKLAIAEARQQIKTGATLSHEKANLQIEKWLEI